ncbi:uncharacterized protein [Salvelinus alpinus]|uniref:uncharacterized protein isoform X1 n=1 Tax=Salvelinus alpinus TaxID=8036 RepID=UPI0039FC066F
MNSDQQPVQVSCSFPSSLLAVKLIRPTRAATIAAAPSRGEELATLFGVKEQLTIVASEKASLEKTLCNLTEEHNVLLGLRKSMEAELHNVQVEHHLLWIFMADYNPKSSLQGSTLSRCQTTLRETQDMVRNLEERLWCLGPPHGNRMCLRRFPSWCSQPWTATTCAASLTDSGKSYTMKRWRTCVGSSPGRAADLPGLQEIVGAGMAGLQPDRTGQPESIHSPDQHE